jgi:hypothetical protein
MAQSNLDSEMYILYIPKINAKLTPTLRGLTYGGAVCGTLGDAASDSLQVSPIPIVSQFISP